MEIKTETLGVMLLATENKTNLILALNTNQLILRSELRGEEDVFFINGQYHHLYFTSNANIKVNDYITDGYAVWQWKDDCSLLGRRKIEATNDKSILVELSKEWKTPYSTGFPKISTDYVQEFIKSYNEGNVLTEVKVEIRYNTWQEFYQNKEIWENNIKTTPDNYVVIYKEENKALSFAQKINRVTDYDIGRFYGRLEGYKEATVKEATDKEERMYSREEVHNLLMMAWITGQSKPECHYSVREDWIKEHLDKN